jgi:hypothetical protein
MSPSDILTQRADQAARSGLTVIIIIIKESEVTANRPDIVIKKK